MTDITEDRPIPSDEDILAILLAFMPEWCARAFMVWVKHGANNVVALLVHFASEDSMIAVLDMWLKERPEFIQPCVDYMEAKQA